MFVLWVVCFCFGFCVSVVGFAFLFCSYRPPYRSDLLRQLVCKDRLEFNLSVKLNIIQHILLDCQPSSSSFIDGQFLANLKSFVAQHLLSPH